MSTNTEPARILVVDDNEMNRDMLSRRLVRQGHDVSTAIHGVDALDRLRSEPFDLVLLDIMMPEMNGFELLERLKADPRLEHLPVILISALDDTDSVVRGIQMGADDHLPKPFNPSILRARVDACLAKKRLRDRERLYAEALEREIDIAREIQAGFLPEALPDAPGWEIAARFHPARQVGGDFYDAFAIDGDRIVLVVADVCDKGVGAALFMALFRSLIRVVAERVLGASGETGEGRGEASLEAGDGAAGVSRVVRSVNDYIARTHSRENMFATVFVGVLAVGSGELTYVNAGHDPPFVLGPGGIRARLAPTGPAVGLLPGLEFGVGRARLAAGETLVAFTDGVTDARNEEGDTFSEDRLEALVAGLAGLGLTADELLGRIEEAVAEHAGAGAAFDDVTILATHRL